MKGNKGFYERYQEEQKQEEKIENLKKKFHLADDKTIVLENRSSFEKCLLLIFNITKILIKTAIYIGIFILSTIGATVLMNEALRNTFFELIQTIF